MTNPMPVGLAFAYLKGQNQLYEQDTAFKSRLLFAQQQFRQAVKRENTFWARRLEQLAYEVGML